MEANQAGERNTSKSADLDATLVIAIGDAAREQDHFFTLAIRARAVIDVGHEEIISTRVKCRRQKTSKSQCERIKGMAGSHTQEDIQVGLGVHPELTSVVAEVGRHGRGCSVTDQVESRRRRAAAIDASRAVGSEACPADLVRLAVVR